MERNSILYILRSNNLPQEHLKLFETKLKNKSFTIDDFDKLLVKLGYENIFDLHDEIDEDFDYYDDYIKINKKTKMEE